MKKSKKYKKKAVIVCHIKTLKINLLFIILREFEND
jgi:hypothetical protein